MFWKMIKRLTVNNRYNSRHYELPKGVQFYDYLFVEFQADFQFEIDEIFFISSNFGVLTLDEKCCSSTILSILLKYKI